MKERKKKKKNNFRRIKEVSSQEIIFVFTTMAKNKQRKESILFDNNKRLESIRQPNSFQKEKQQNSKIINKKLTILG